MRCYLFDVDGTLADNSHRQHFLEKSPKDWDSFFSACAKDTPIEHMCQVARRLGRYATVLCVTGRRDRERQETLEWLFWHVNYCNPLYMRKDGDYRPDHEVKSDLLDTILADGYKPIMAFDDRTSVVRMWRSRGIACAQVADGDF